jgi:hypothetical protein
VSSRRKAIAWTVGGVLIVIYTMLPVLWIISL